MVTRVPVPPWGTIRAYVRMVGAITTTKLRVPADIWDVDKCLAWSDEEVEQATVRLDIHTDGQRIRRLLWIPPGGVHTAGESSKATVTCTEFVNQKRRSLTLQQQPSNPRAALRPGNVPRTVRRIWPSPHATTQLNLSAHARRTTNGTRTPRRAMSHARREVPALSYY